MVAAGAVDGCNRRCIQVPLQEGGEVGSPVPEASRHRPQLLMQLEERGRSWARVEADGSPGQSVEVALGARVVSGQVAGLEWHLPLKLVHK